MSKSSGVRRHRQRERRFIQFYDRLSLRATVAAVAATSGFLVWLTARTLFER